jgi:hypothetical protein
VIERQYRVLGAEQRTAAMGVDEGHARIVTNKPC